jgi:hypothetical protein
VGRAAELAWSDDDQTLLPDQFFRAAECGPYGYGPGSGPRRLMVAVLVDALRSVVEQPANSKAVARQRKDREWLASDSSARLFSFRRICAVLELDPQAVRTAIYQHVVAHQKLRRVYAAHRTIGALAGTVG